MRALYAMNPGTKIAQPRAIVASAEATANRRIGSASSMPQYRRGSTPAATASSARPVSPRCSRKLFIRKWDVPFFGTG